MIEGKRPSGVIHWEISQLSLIPWIGSEDHKNQVEFIDRVIRASRGSPYADSGALFFARFWVVLMVLAFVRWVAS